MMDEKLGENVHTCNKNHKIGVKDLSMKAENNTFNKERALKTK